MTQILEQDRNKAFRARRLVIRTHSLDPSPVACVEPMARVRRGSRTGGKRPGSESPESPRNLRPKVTIPSSIDQKPIADAQPYFPLPGGFRPTVGPTFNPPNPPNSAPPQAQFTSLQGNYAGHPPGPQSPESAISTGSQGTSTFGVSSFESGSIASLERKRHLSHDDTPTHSVASIERSFSQEGFSAFLSPHEGGHGFGNGFDDRGFQQGTVLWISFPLQVFDVLRGKRTAGWHQFNL